MILRIFRPGASSYISTTITSTVTMIHKRRSLLCLTAAAALSSSVQAWVSTSPAYHSTMLSTRELSKISSTQSLASHGTSRSLLMLPRRGDGSLSRLYYSSKDSGEENGIISSVGNAVKSILPKSWFESKEEKEAKLRQKQLKQDMAGSIQEMFKDAPLGIRMMGKMVAPMISGMASTLAEGLAEQQKTTEKLLEDATGYIVNDPDVLSALGGEPIRVGSPFSQSSSTTSINGKMQSRIELGVPVSGRSGSGTARILSTQDGISSIQVEVMGRVMNVSTIQRVGGGSRKRSGGPRRSGGYSSSGNDDNIIEAEIIDKDTK